MSILSAELDMNYTGNYNVTSGNIDILTGSSMGVDGEVVSIITGILETCKCVILNLNI